MNRAIIILIVGLFLMSCVSPFTDESWDKISETQSANIEKVILTESTNRDAIISHSYIDTPEEVLSKIEYLIENESFDPILYEIYLAFKLARELDDDNVLPLLLRYASNDEDNAIPLYFLSYFYSGKHNYDEGLKYLRQGNLRGQCQLYIQEKKRILFDYVLSKTNDHITAYSSQFIVHNPDVFIVLRGLSKQLLDNFSSELHADEISEIGRKLERSSLDVIDKTFGLAMQMSVYTEEADPKVYASLDKRRKYYLSIIERAYEQRGREKLMQYLETAFRHGEIYALEQLGNP